MTDINPRDLIQRLAKELDRYRQIALDDRTSTHPLADEARAYLAQPEPEGLTDEELLQIAAATIEPYESCGIAIGEYEPENECAVEVYGSELIDFARAAFARARAATTTETP